METLKAEFENWTAYDDWLIQHYDEYAMVKVEEVNGKVLIEYMNKEDWNKLQREKDS